MRKRQNKLKRLLAKGIVHAQGGGGGGGFSTSFSDITGSLGDIFGTEQTGKQRTAGETEFTGTQRERLILDEAAIQKIIQDVLGGAEGLASIFQGEQVAGVFDSSVAAQAAGDLASRLVGEIAKLTGVKETTQESLERTTGVTKTKAGDEGLLGGALSGIADVFGF